MATRTSSKKTGSIVKLDLRKTERGKKGGHRYPEDDYKIKIVKAERKESQSGNTQIVMHCTILAPEKYKGKPLIDRVTLTEAAMFRVGWLLDAVGIKWKNSVINFPLSKLEGKVLGVALYDDDYNGKTTSKVSEYYSEEEVDDFLNAEDDDDDEDEDDDDEDADEEDEDDDDEDDEELDLDEDDDDDEEDLNDLSIAELKKRARAAKVKGYKTMKKKALVAALEDEDDDEDDDDEDDL
jgi:hypothetical protein